MSEQNLEYLWQPSNRSGPSTEIKQNQRQRNTTLTVEQSNQFCSDTAGIGCGRTAAESFTGKIYPIMCSNTGYSVSPVLSASDFAVFAMFLRSAGLS